LIEEAVKNMLSDLRTYEQHDYIVTEEDQIGYKEQDGISFTATYGIKQGERDRGFRGLT
jgi:hypothetical protein